MEKTKSRMSKIYQSKRLLLHILDFVSVVFIFFIFILLFEIVKIENRTGENSKDIRTLQTENSELKRDMKTLMDERAALMKLPEQQSPEAENGRFEKNFQ